MGVTVTSPHGVDLTDALKRFPDEVSRHVLAGMDRATALLIRELESSTSIGATGELAKSWTAGSEIQSPGHVAAEVGTELEHGVYAELGTRPHWAPIAPLLNWVVNGPIGEKDEASAKRIAYAVQAKIAKKGTDGQYTLRNAYTKTLNDMTKALQNSMEDAISEIVGNGQ